MAHRRGERSGGARGGAGGRGVPASPRSAYSAKKREAEGLTMDLMMNLDAHTIANIKKEFVENGGEVDMYEFVRIMRTYLPEHLEVRSEADAEAEGASGASDAAGSGRGGAGGSGAGGGAGAGSRGARGGRAGRRAGRTSSAASLRGPSQNVTEMQLVANLCELFKEIDVNGDEMMEWDEFTSFIVDKAVVFRNDASVDAIAGYTPVTVVPPEAKQGRKGKSLRKARFHNELIENIKFIPRLNQLAVLEQRTPVVKMYDARTFALQGELRGHDGIPEAVEYFETPSSYLISSCADSTMALWDLNPGNKQYSYITCWPTPHVQMSLAWSEQYTTLYSGSTTGLVHSWDIKSREETSCMAGHSDIVMDLIAIKQLDNIASASLDSTICMWDMCSGAQRQCLRGHTKGVLSLTYCPDFRFLISSGFDHDALVWSPFVPSLLFKLKGHSTPLVGVRSVPNKPEVITAAVDGQFKVWDLRSFKCVQTFADEGALLQNVAAFDHCPPLRRIVSATKKLAAFDQGGERQLTKVTDQLPITCAVFNATSMTILTASARTVKVWNALTGTLLRVYRDVSDSDITSICLDDRQRKFIAGEANGAVRVYNYANGAVMKSMVSHSREVSKVLYCNELKVVVSTSWDRSIVVHDEMDPEKGVVLRMMDHMRRHQNDVSCAAWSHPVSLVATGSSDKTVRVWDLETGKLEALLPHPAEVVSVQFLTPYPFLISADSSGNIFLWGVRNSNCKHILAAAWSLNPAGFWPAIRASAEAAQAEVDDAYNAKVAERTARREAAEKKRRRGRSSGEALPGKDEEVEEEKIERGVAGPEPSVGGKRARELAAMKHTFQASYAACLEWDAEKALLYTGDERGQLAAWGLGDVLATIDDEGEKPGNVRCQADVDSRAADSTMSALYDGPALVSLQWVKRVHHDAITSVQYVPDPTCIVTASYDRCVYAWDLTGRSIGLLCRAVRNGRNPYWNLPVDVAARQESERTATAATLEELTKRHSVRQEAQDISDRRAKAAAKARARQSKDGSGAHKVGTGHWAAEAEASRHRSRQRKDKAAEGRRLLSRDGAGSASAGGSKSSMGLPSSRIPADAESTGPASSRRRLGPPKPLPPRLLSRVKPKASPLEATRSEWAGSEMPSRETQRRVASALHSMSSQMVGRTGRLPKKKDLFGAPSHVPAVADSEILQSLTDSYSARGAGAGAGAGSGRGAPRSGSRRAPSSSLMQAGAATLEAPAVKAAPARGGAQFNSKTIEAAARLGAILSDLG